MVFGYLTQNLSARSLFLKKPSIIMPFWYINTVIGFVIDVVYFGDSFDWMSILGMMLTSSGLLMKLLIS